MGSMDQNDAELVRLLCTRIGMIMEDASVIALSLGGPGSEIEPQSVENLTVPLRLASNLVEAVRSLAE